MTEAPQKIHDAEKVAYSSVVGQAIMLMNASGACIAQLSVINTSEPQRIADEVVAALKAPNRHAYKVGVAVGKSAQREAALQDMVEFDGQLLTQPDPPAAVTVKPLEWVDLYCDGSLFQPSIDHPLGYHAVIHSRGENGWWYFGPYETLEEAKAAAQADYERRILSCLTTQPDPVKDAARVLLAQWEEHGEGVQGNLACYSLEGEDGEPGRMEPDTDGGWVKFDDVTAALSALAEQE